MATRDKPRFMLIIEAPEATNDEAVRRLRALLKALLRGYRLRCVEAKRVDALEAKPDALEGK